jgi:short-subunit dehydrogenase
MPRPLAAITGASSGLGELYARKLASKYDLLLVARNKPRLEELAAELSAAHGSKVGILDADLSDAAQIKRVAERIAAEPELELLINNAGFGDRGPFWEADIEVLDKMHLLHINALVRLSHAALRVMVPKNRGAIINLSSVAAFARRAGSASYSATKSWVAAFTEGLYVDLKHKGSAVVVQSLCPGYTYTRFHDVMQADRRLIAGPSMWLTAEHVVGDSLAALPRGDLYVIPGWRYRWMVRLLYLLPRSLKFRAAALASSAPAASR